MKAFAILLAALVSAAAASGQETTAAAAPAGAEHAPWTLDGSLLVQPLAGYAGGGSWSTSNLSYGSASTLGVTLRAGSGRARAEASVEGTVLTGSSAATASAVAASPYGRADELLVPATGAGSAGQDAALAARIRTLYARLDLDGASFTAGRQVVNYSRGSLWSPTDIFTELDLAGISPVRRGTDALRLTVPLGVTAGLDAVAAPTLTPGDGRYSLRANALVGDVDAAVVAGRDGSLRGWLFGADFKTDLEVGLTGEAIYDLPDSGGAGWVRAAAGVDWSTGDFVLAAEYYYNGGGASADLLFPGTHNLYGSVTWSPSELLQLTLEVIADVRGAAGTSTLTARVSAAQNADVTAFLQAGNGNAGYGIGYGVGSASWTAQAGMGLEVKF